MTEGKRSGTSMRIGRYFDTAPYWSASSEGRLLLQFCTISQRFQAYPRPGSVFSGRRALEWREAEGKGVLASWTIDRMNAPKLDDSPRMQALVDLSEGVRLLTWLVDCESDQLKVNMPLRLAWVALEDGYQWPAFAPDRG